MKINWKMVVLAALLPGGIFIAGSVIGYNIWKTLRDEKRKNKEN